MIPLTLAEIAAITSGSVTPGGEVKRLFREKTKAWVEDLGAPVFLKDGSFLLVSGRSGWNHL